MAHGSYPNKSLILGKPNYLLFVAPVSSPSDTPTRPETPPVLFSVSLAASFNTPISSASHCRNGSWWKTPSAENHFVNELSISLSSRTWPLADLYSTRSLYCADCFLPEDRMEIYQIPLASQFPNHTSQSTRSLVRRERNSTYHFSIPTPPSPPKHLPALNHPNPNRKQGIQSEIHAHGRHDPRRPSRLPPQVPVRVEREACDCDGRVADHEADGGFGVVLREGVGLRERGQVGG